MEISINPENPRRISDLVAAAAAGESVNLQTDFEILPVEFLHQANPFQAYIFLARYSGTIGARPFAFRKCYARGCPNNLCIHVSQAVAVANRYLQRDYHTLTCAGIAVAEVFFSLEEMIVKFESLKADGPAPLTIPEVIDLAAAGGTVGVELELEIVPAVEHFGHQKNAQTFLSGQFTFRLKDRQYVCQRCFACYASDHDAHEKAQAVTVANARLQLIFDQFARAGIGCATKLFS
jgi:hypothetical protein